MKKNLFKLIFFVFLALMAVSPILVSAQGETEEFCSLYPEQCQNGTSTGACTTGLSGILCKLSVLLDAILPFLVALGVIYFVWGMVQYFIADSEEAKKTGKERILYGIIGLAVIVSVWGLVTIVQDTFGVGQKPAQDVSSLIAVPESSGDCTIGSKFQGLLDYVTCIIGNSVIPFIFAIAMVMFVWGAVKFFIINADEEKKRQEGKQFMLWGIIALTVMISVWGLVTILGVTFGLDTKVLPEVKPSSSLPVPP